LVSYPKSKISHLSNTATMQIRITVFSALLILCLFVNKANAQGQEPFFTQFFNMPLHLNPSTVGMSGQRMNAAALFRTQWMGMGGGYQTAAVSFDYATMKNLNVGALILHDNLGNGNLTNTSLHTIVGYSNSIPGALSFSGGLQFGVFNRRADFTDVTFVDEILLQNPFASELDGPESAFYGNLSMGGLIATPFAWFGASWHNMGPAFFQGQPIEFTKNSPLLMEENINSYGKLSLHAGFDYRFPNVDYFTGFSMFNWRKQGPERQLDLLTGIKFGKQYRNLMIGAGYRSIFWPGEAVDLTDRDAITFMVSMDFETDFTNIRIAYSYDLTVSGLSPFSGGAHEGGMVMGSNGFTAKQVRDWENWVEDRRIVCPLAYNRSGTMFKVNEKAKRQDSKFQKKRNKNKRKNMKKGRKKRRKRN